MSTNAALKLNFLYLRWIEILENNEYISAYVSNSLAVFFNKTTDQTCVKQVCVKGVMHSLLALVLN